MSNYVTVLAQSGAESANMFSMILMFVVIIAFFYFLMIRPQKKKDKEQKLMRENIQIGDEVMTIGGIVGFVVKKTEDTVVIETGGDRSKLRIKIWAIQENITVSERMAEAKAEKNKALLEARQNKINSKKKDKAEKE